jgi:endonuclease/exonuclease/phosphatase family metal-dependent hydrolase
MGSTTLHSNRFTRNMKCGRAAVAITAFPVIVAVASCTYTPNWEIHPTEFIEHQVKVMSFNIHGDDSWTYGRGELVYQAIETVDPDIIGLQEAKVYQVYNWFPVELPEYDAYGRGKQEDLTGSTNAILYRRDRFDLLDSGTFWYSNRPDKPGTVPGEKWGSPKDNPRICSWVRLRDKRAGFTFYVFNTHLMHNCGMKSCVDDVCDNFCRQDAIKWRRKAGELLEDRIRSRDHDDPFIVTGDFNATTGEDVIDIMTRHGSVDIEFGCPTRYNRRCCAALWDEYGEAAAEMTCVETLQWDDWYLIDVWAFFSPNNNYGTRCGAEHSRGGRRIDYIFVSRDIDPLEMEPFLVYDPEDCPSDHLPVTALLWIP